nr:nuclear autoantigen Sp-100-like [Microcebus murinus]
MDAGNNSALEKHSGKRKRKTAIPGPFKRRSSRTGKRRDQRIPKDESMNFQCPELPVTCGKAKGTLYKEKLKKGTSERCIKSETRRWFTPREFEVTGGYKTSSNWKLSIRCGGFTLKELIEKGYLQKPPTSMKKWLSNDFLLMPHQSYCWLSIAVALLSLN